MSSPLISRMQRNAQYLIDNYPSANTLLQAAVKEAVPWAMPLATQGRVPPLPNIERLATQLLAILMASEPKEPTIAESIHGLKWGGDGE